MEWLTMSSRRLPRVGLQRLGSLCLFAVMLLAVLLEAASVYWLVSPSTFSLRPDSPRELTTEWTAHKIPQYWLAGAFAVLLYRLAVILRPPRIWSLSEAQRNRQAFFRLWRWTVTFGALQMFSVYLDRISLGGR